MNSEAVRIADQLRRAFAGDAWHGSSLRDLLAGITAAEACARPLPQAHSIWELVLHSEAWVNAAREATRGVSMPNLYGTEGDWPPVVDTSAGAWAGVTDRLLESGEQLARAIEGFDDARLQDTVPGREYDYYYLFHGIAQHSLYHGGQIAMLKRAVSPEPSSA